MPGNSFGTLLRITTFGESHGLSVGVIVDGCPAGLALSESDIQSELDRRRPGQSRISTSRSEPDAVRIVSGVFEGQTTGTPIMLTVDSVDQKSHDYTRFQELFRPSHADFTYYEKYGHRDHRGGGRTSARILIGRVAAGAIAKKWLWETCGTECLAYTESVGTIHTDIRSEMVTSEMIEANIVRCPDSNVAEVMIAHIDAIRQDGDSVGGVIRGLIRSVPVGLGEPEFDKVGALLAHGMMSINAVKGFDIGSGFAGTHMRGSEHNDIPYRAPDGRIHTRTNHAGGMLGGITNGETIDFRVAFKPVATIAKSQETIDLRWNSTTVEGKGRHDPCVLPRAVPVVEAMAALVIMDLLLIHRAASR